MRKDFKKEGTYLSTLWSGYWKYKKLEEELLKYRYIYKLMNSSLNPPFEMGDQAKPKRCLEY